MRKFLSLCMAVLMIFTIAGCSTEEHEGEAKTPSGSSVQKGRDYQEVYEQFEKEGFVNIQLEALDDLIIGWLTKDGEVESVSVDGDIGYSADTWYPADVEIIITYHTFPIRESESSDVTAELAESDAGEITSSPESNPASVVESKLTASSVPVEEEKDYVLNTNTMKFHYPSCSSADNIKTENKAYFYGTREEVIAQGYQSCGRCHP